MIFMALLSRILRRIPPQPLATTVARHNSQQAGQPYGQQPAWPGNQQAGGWPYAKAANSPVRAHIRAGTRAMQGQPYGQQPNGQPYQPHYG